MKKILTITLVAIFAMILMFTLVACGEQGEKGDQGIKGEKGDQGIQGEKGDQGDGVESIILDEDGNLVITFSDGTTQVLEHNWEKLCTIEPVRCTSDGKDLYSCADCNIVRVVTVPQTGHTYSETIVEPTCFEQGYTLHKCECGDSYKDTFVDSDIEHDFKKSDICENCNQNIADVSVECYNLSASIDDNVYGYVVPNLCNPEGSGYDVYIKGIGETRACSYSPDTYGVFENEAHRMINHVYISEGVTRIGEGLLAGYDYLTEIDVDPNNTIYKSIDGDLYTKDGKTLVQHSIGKFGSEFLVPDGVTTIGAFAFAESIGHNSVILPESVAEICEYAFTASNIVYINIPEGVVNIKYLAFERCDNLIAVGIPESLKTIGSYAFFGCSKLNSVHYAGTEEQWSEIVIAEGNSYLMDANRKYNSVMVVE